MSLSPVIPHDSRHESLTTLLVADSLDESYEQLGGHFFDLSRISALFLCRIHPLADDQVEIYSIKGTQDVQR